MTDAPISAASFDWFWQPPLDGDPGIIMIRDTHPGPDAVGLPFVGEDLENVLLTVESRIPPDVHLHELRVYARDVLGLWVELAFNCLGRQFTKKTPAFSQGDLEAVWNNHETRAGRA